MEPSKHQYDFDTATSIGFLREYGLDKDFKINIEVNHATLAQGQASLLFSMPSPSLSSYMMSFLVLICSCLH